MTLNDMDLVEEIRAGSRAAFDQLIRRHEHLVYRIAFSYAGEVESALDISQNVFLKLHRQLGNWHGRGTFRAWLARIAQNESLNWLRGQKRHRGDVELTYHNTPFVQAVQETDLIRAERIRDLQAEIGKLHHRQQQAMLLRYFDRMPIREISEVLECSEGQVKSILFRGLKALRKHLPHQGRWDQELNA